jgi:hypothetical protein
VSPGIDPIIGQKSGEGRNMRGVFNKPETKLELPQQWVESKGGEYFFAPSIEELKKGFMRRFAK